MPETSLQRFLPPQALDYPTALSEIKRGRKTSHWIWYIFPQVYGLGLSQYSKFYGIKDLKEAEEYLQHPVLGKRLTEISDALLQLESNDAHKIFGSPDDMKVKSCMTLFAAIPNADPVFQKVLDKFYNGGKDERTMGIIG